MLDVIGMLAHPVKEAGGALLRRVGTFFSAFLLAHGVPDELVNQLLVAAGVFLGISFDIAVAIFYRQRLKIAVKRLEGQRLQDEREIV